MLLDGLKPSNNIKIEIKLIYYRYNKYYPMASAGNYGYNINDIISGFEQAKKILNECVFSGSTAIAFLCNSLDIQYDENQLLHAESDIDAYYCSEKMVYTSSFGDWKRKDSMPGKHVTFLNGNNMPLNFHWEKVSSISYIEVEGFRFKTISTMLDDYDDVLEDEDDKLEYKKSLLLLIQECLEDVAMPTKKMYRA